MKYKFKYNNNQVILKRKLHVINIKEGEELRWFESKMTILMTRMSTQGKLEV